jgi:arylsulfatase A-like enzyme
VRLHTSRAMGALTRVPLLFLFLFVFVFLAGCERPTPNVLLVTIDTLRADHLSSYGYERPTSPYLDELAASGVRFDRAYASSSWTAPSIASLLTSLDPRSHGIAHGHLADQAIVHQEVLPDSVEMWAELLRDAGYRTYGVTANTHLYGRFGFDQGFDRYECLGFLSADDVRETVERWADEIRGDAPWFLWVHLLDPHSRYQPRSPWIEQYFPRYRRLWRPLRGVLVPEDYQGFGVTAGSRKLDVVRALYDSEISYTDYAVRSIAATLGVSDDDLVVVTSDHGEEFLDHDHFGHGVTLYEEVIRVPLLLRLPGARHAGRVVRTAVRLIDILPTVLDELGIEAPATLQGVSLLPQASGTTSANLPVTASLERFPALAKDSITIDGWKYIDPRPEGERPQLFDLNQDPGEQRDLYERQPERAAELARRLAASAETSRAKRIEPDAVDLSEDEFDQLKALGYVPR